MAKRRNSADSVSGVATVRCNPTVVQFTVIPDSGASGTATVEVRVEDSDQFETLYDSNGDALSWTLSATRTHTLNKDGKAPKIAAIRVTSDNSGDDFTVAWR